jgi:two-component system, cell cycle sensor histidine kinase and response regulator CckA
MREATKTHLPTAQQQLDYFLLNSPAVVYCVRLDDDIPEISWVSENCQRLLGFGAGEICRPEWWPRHVHPKDRDAAAACRTQIYECSPIVSEYRLQHKNGSYRWIRDEQRLVLDSGRPVEIVGSWIDVNERRLLEQQLRQSQKLETIGQLAGGVAHDFNNLLTVIGGNNDLAMMNEMQFNVETRELLQEATSAAQRASHLTRHLLAFSRKEHMQLEVLNLNHVISNFSKMLTRIVGENIRMKFNYAEGLGAVRADVE